MSDPSILEKISKKKIDTNVNKREEKKFPSKEDKKEEEKSMILDIYHDYKTTSFYKKLGLPRSCTLYQVIFKK